MFKLLKKAIIGGAVFWASAGTIVLASVIAQQLTHSNPFTGGTYRAQTLGTGLTGTVQTITIWTDAGGPASQTIYLRDCTDSGYTSCTSNSATGTMGPGSEADVFTLGTPLVLNASHYYFISGINAGFDHGGSSGSSYANGQYLTCTSATDYTTCTGQADDLYFVVEGEAGGGGASNDPIFYNCASATSSICAYIVDNPNLNIALAVLLFFFNFYGMIWLFSKKR